MLATLIEDFRNDFTKNIDNVVANNLKVEDKHLIRALWLGLPLTTISQLIERGASIINYTTVYDGLSEPFDQYPLTIAIEAKLDIEYIKLLDNTYIPPVYKIWLIKKYKPTKNIILFLLKNIDNFMMTDKYTQQWDTYKYSAPFFSKARARPSKYLYNLTPLWYTPNTTQQVSRMIRSANHNKIILKRPSDQ